MAGFLLPVLTTASKALKVPALAAFIAGLAANIMAWFSKRLARGLVINATILTLIFALTLALSATLYAMATALSYVVHPAINQSWSLFMPSNAIPCLSTILSAKLVRWVWMWQYFAIVKMAS